MNVYEFIVIDGRLLEISECPKVYAHGATEAHKVGELFKQGQSIEEIKKQFCSYCCGKLPCGCSNPSPQGGGDKE